MVLAETVRCRMSALPSYHPRTNKLMQWNRQRAKRKNVSRRRSVNGVAWLYYGLWCNCENYTGWA